MDYSQWMSQTPALHGLQLRNICLPATHDSGAYLLRQPMLPEANAALAEAINVTQEVLNALKWVPDLPIWFAAAVLDAAVAEIQAVSVATQRTVAEQLADGIRCLDLRVAYFSEPPFDGSEQWFTYHGLTGTNLDGQGIIAEIASFLAANPGEILVITMGHWVNAEAGDIASFSDFVASSLAEWIYPRPDNFQLLTYSSAGETPAFTAVDPTGAVIGSFPYGATGDLPVGGRWAAGAHETWASSGPPR